MPENPVPAREAVLGLLVAAARDRRTVSYDDVVAATGTDDLPAVLRSISVAEDEAGRGLLTALVVHDPVRADGLPGAGWFRLAADRGRDVGDRRAAWAAEVERVFAAWA